MERVSKAALLLTSILYLAPDVATAQSTPVAEPAGPDQGTEIVVTAQGRVQRLQDVPVSVSAISGSALAQSNITTLQDLSNRSPNFKISTGNAISDFITIRGVGSSLNLGFEQSVGTFVDGIYRRRARAARAAFFDIDRVEVLKGPQTTFFGNSTIGGAINITTRQPGTQFGANMSAFYAPNIGEYSVEAGVDLPLSDNLSVRIAGRQSGQRGYVTNTFLKTKGPRLNDKVGRVSARWEPSSSIQVTARVDGGRNRDNINSFTELTNCPPSAEYGAPRGPCARYLAQSGAGPDDTLNRLTSVGPTYFDYDFVEAELATKIDLGDNALTFRSGYFQHHSELLADSPPAGPAGGSVVGTLGSTPAVVGERFHEFSQEVRLQSSEAKPFSYLMGAFYSHARLTSQLYQGLFFSAFGALAPGFYSSSSRIGRQFIGNETSDTLSAFVSGTYRISNALRVNGGLRYTSVRKHAFRSASVGTIGEPVGPDSFVPGPAGAQAILGSALGTEFGDFLTPRRRDSKLMPSVSVQYDIVPDFMTYVSYSSGFKAGAFSLSLSDRATLSPETVDSFEAGFKSQMLGRRVTLNVALFHSKYHNLQQTTSIILPSGALRQVAGNVGSATSKGVEASLNLKLTNELSLNGDLAYLSAHYDSYAVAPCTQLQALQTPVGCTQNLSGRPQAFAPEWSGNVGVKYSRPISNNLQISLGASSYFTSRFYQQPNDDPELVQPGYVKVDARIALARQDKSWEFAIVARNLTDKLTSGFRQAVAGSPGSTIVLADPPRSIGAQLNIQF
ncbi:TonB-dependent receptor [Sphingobium sp. SCG-1]|uniref:TonB-dependent receptor n=1 Tax=Sphingobium sp. SCG-1 TaxID=2072936 RepID=UPI000CD6A622|nr:TonB-dependent receptor [Sphingobium sp. SCG-1]AUW57510.1 TonB-dependent receptor [Sphingobium sp. SCG-1]